MTRTLEPSADDVLAIPGIGAAIGAEFGRQANRFNQQTLQQLLDKLPAGAYTCDADGLITWFNDSALGVWGREPAINDPVDRFCGSFRMYIDGQPIRHDECWMARALKERRGFNGEEIVVEQPNGTRRTVLAHANPLLDASGNVTGALNVLVDITDRKTAEDAARQSYAQFEILLDTLPTGAYTCDARGQITYYNRQAVALWGRVPRLNDPSEVYSGAAKRFVNGEQVSPAESWTAHALRENRPFLGHEVTIERPDETRVTCLVHATPLRDALGHVTGAVTVLVDISDRKRAEEALRETDRSKDLFLAKLAQEMRNQLVPTRGVLQMLKGGSGGATQDQARRLLQRQIEQVAQLVDNLVDIASITRGRMTLRKEKVELGAAVRNAVTVVQDRIDTSNHKLVVTFPNSQIFVHADPARLSQAIAGLLTNAVKFTERGGRIWLTAEQSGSHVVLSVRDTGIGIPAADLPQIFDMIANMDRTVRNSQGGVGIGLALVRGIIELHGGIIEARSDGPGQGSEFIVRLPVSA